MKTGLRAVVIGLSAALLLPIWAMAAQVPAEGRLEDLDFLYDTLKENHPDLFTNTPEEVFSARKAEIADRLAADSQAEFVLDLQSLAALAGDSHTTLSLSFEEIHYYPFTLDTFGSSWVLTRSDRREDVGKTVTAVAGLTMDEFCRQFSVIVSADNEIKLARQVKSVCYAAEILDYLGLTNQDGTVTLTLASADGTTEERIYSPLTPEMFSETARFRLADFRSAAPATEYDKNRAYFSLSLNEETYYIQYNVCQEDPELPMETFAAQVQSDLQAGGYTQVLLDLRNNGGGSDGVVIPLLMVLREEMEQGGLRLFCLIGETTFSSGIINAVEIREMGAVLAGTLTSGSVDHFGSVRSYQLPNSGLTLRCSSKWIAMDGLLEAAIPYGVEPLKPDISIAQTLEDYLGGKDTLVEDLLKNGAGYSLPAEPSAPLTRGRLAWLLWQEAGSPPAEQYAPFQDLIPCSYYAGAVSWAQANEIVTGVSQAAFQASRPVTRQEAAVMLNRYAAWKGLSSSGKPAVSYNDTPAPWAAQAVEQVCAWGLMTADLGLFQPDSTMTRSEGEAAVAALAALLERDLP